MRPVEVAIFPVEKYAERLHEALELLAHCMLSTVRFLTKITREPLSFLQFSTKRADTFSAD